MYVYNVRVEISPGFGSDFGGCQDIGCIIASRRLRSCLTNAQYGRGILEWHKNEARPEVRSDKNQLRRTIVSRENNGIKSKDDRKAADELRGKNNRARMLLYII